MAADNDGVLDLSTTPCRRSPDIDEPYVKVEPSSPNPSFSESDSGLDIVDSARNSTDERPPGSPSASVNSSLALSPKQESSDSPHDGQLPPMPPMLMLPQPPGLTVPANDGQDSPFKMYPYDAMSMIMNPLMAGMSGVDGAPFPGSVTQLMSQRRRRTGEKRSATTSDDGSDHPTPPKKAQGTPVPSDKKDESYWERRRRNNDAAKRSRDMRRRKEEEIAMRAAYLEQENLKLRAQVAILKNETAKLHYLLYNRV